MNKYKESQWTPIKQRRYRQLVNWSCAAINAIWNKHKGASWLDDKFYFIDTTCGPGVSKNGKDGSPLILLNQLHSNNYKFPATLDFIDVEENYIEELRFLIEGYSIREKVKVNLHCGDNKLVLKKILNNKENTKWTYGFIYNDPSGEIPKFDEISNFCEVAGMFPCDVIINCPATTINRVRMAKHCVEDRCFIEWINCIPKKFWFLTEPVGKHRWTMMLGTNWDHAKLYGDFYRNDSFEGMRILKKLNLTKKEIGANNNGIR